MISVVIPAYNEEKRIARCLNAFKAQTTKEDFEVILVDNNSTDKTAEIARTYKKNFPLQILIETNKGRGAARKHGFDSAQGEIILSTDADTTVPHNWIEVLSTELRKYPCAAVTGTCTFVDCDTKTKVFLTVLQPLATELYRIVIGHYWLSGFNFAIYKKIYKKSGGFDEDLNTQEDVELSFRVKELRKIRFIKKAPVEFSARRFQEGLIEGLFSYSKTYIEHFIFKKKDVYLSDVR